MAEEGRKGDNSSRPAATRAGVPSALVRQVQKNAVDVCRILVDKPSIGLYYIQLHVHRSVPKLISSKNQISNVTRSSVRVTEEVKFTVNEIKRLKSTGSTVLSNILSSLESSSGILSSLEAKYSKMDPSKSSKQKPFLQPLRRTASPQTKELGSLFSNPDRIGTSQIPKESSPTSLSNIDHSTTSDESSTLDSKNEKEPEETSLNQSPAVGSESERRMKSNPNFANQLLENGITNVTRLGLEGIKLIDSVKSIGGERVKKTESSNLKPAKSDPFDWKKFSNSLVHQIKKIDKVLPPLQLNEKGKSNPMDNMEGSQNAATHQQPSNESTSNNFAVDNKSPSWISDPVDEDDSNRKTRLVMEANSESELFDSFKNEKQLNLEKWLEN